MMILLANGGGGFPSVHPILVNFTAGLIPASFAFDLLGAWLKKDVLRAVGWWTLLLGACLTPLTALAGWLWMRSMEHADHWQMPIHMWLGFGLAFLFIALAAWRGWLYRHDTAPDWLYALAASVLLGAVMYQGDLGGSMSFGRGIFISADRSGGHDHGGESHPHGGQVEHHASGETEHHDDAHGDTPQSDAATRPATPPADDRQHSHGEHPADPHH